jgi:hypothetical protein
MREADDFRPAQRAGIEMQRRWLATTTLLVALVVLSILAPRLAGA